MPRTSVYLKRSPMRIVGDRLLVLVSMARVDIQAQHNGRLVRFDSLHEARVFAEKSGYDDGIRVQTSEGYGLLPRVQSLLGSKPKKTKKGKK